MIFYIDEKKKKTSCKFMFEEPLDVQIFLSAHPHLIKIKAIILNVYAISA